MNRILAIFIILATVFGTVANADVTIPDGTTPQYSNSDYVRNYIYRLSGVYLADDSGNTMLLKAPSLADDNTVLTLPATNGSSGQALIGDGSGGLSYGDVVTPTGTQTLTNKTLTAPAISSPTGLVKADVGLGNVDNTSDATKNAATATLENKTLVTPVVDGHLALNEETTPSTPPSGQVLLYPKDDKKLYSLNSDGIEQEVGSGAGTGETNYIEKHDGETDTTGWAVYADTAAATPADGTGGTANVTFTRTTSAGEVLRGDASFELAKDASNRQGQGASYDFTIDPADENKLLKISLDYKTSANYATGDVVVYIYDVTNATLITPSVTSITANTTDGASMEVTWGSTTSNSYRLIFHIASTSASAWDLMLDNIIVGPGRVISGGQLDFPPVNYTPPGDPGMGLTWTVGTASYRRKGSTVDIFIPLTVAGGTVSGNFSYAASAYLPTGLTYDASANMKPAVTWYAISDAASSTADQSMGVGSIGISTGAVTLYGAEIANDQFDATWPFALTTGDYMELVIKGLPIAEWAGSTYVGQNNEEFAFNTSTSDAADTTSFGYGQSGTAMPGALTASRNKRVRFRSAVQPGDRLFLEVNPGNGWIDAEARFPLVFANSTSYGMRWQVTSTPTDVDVFFNQYATAATAATYGGAGESWGSYSSYKWRLRKVSAGSPVGFGQATASLPGLVSSEVQGTWTPVVKEGTNTLSATTSGRYAKYGNLVIVTFAVFDIAVSGTGFITIEGLPYTPAMHTAGPLYIRAVTYSSGEVPVAHVTAGSSVISLITMQSGNNGLGLTAADLHATASDLFGTLTFFTN